MMHEVSHMDAKRFWELLEQGLDSLRVDAAERRDDDDLALR
jgi:hypothetical protein